MTRLIVRGYGDGEQVFEERLDADDADLAILAEKHALELAQYGTYMLEFEFPDDPEPERFLRYGTDTSRMRLPLAVRL